MTDWHGARVSFRSIRDCFRQFRKDRCGAAVVLAAILFPVVVGGMGLGVESGYWYLTQRKLQHAADVSAHAGAVRLRAGDGLPQIEAAARNVAGRSGAAAGFVDVDYPQVNWPPQHSRKGLNGNEDSVEVIISRSQPRLFSAVLDAFYGSGQAGDLAISAHAIAQLQPSDSDACVLALSPSAQGAVTISGSVGVTLAGCNISSNSNASDAFLMSGSSATLSAECIITVGQAVTTLNTTLGCGSPFEYAPPVRDPYKAVAEPTNYNHLTCRNRNVGNPNQTTAVTPSEMITVKGESVPARLYCGGLDAKGTVNFGPGLYIIQGGDFTVNSGNVESSSRADLIGSGVTFYLTDGARLRLAGNAILTLEAPKSGPFSGLVFFGSRGETGITHRINGSSGSTVQGAIYTPASSLDYRGNSKTTDGCTHLIGLRVTFLGNSTLRSSCENAGTTRITSEVVRLVE